MRRATELAARRAGHLATLRARSRATSRARHDEGFAMSSPVALMAAAAVVLAGVGFLLTGKDDAAAHQHAVLAADPAQVAPHVVVKPVKHHHKKAPVVKRGNVYVDVYNNSNVTGLAATTAARIGAMGWQVVGSNNWYGTIPATTIYYPPRFKAAAQLLSKDLGVARVMPAVDPMNMDRLTLILTADFA